MKRAILPIFILLFAGMSLFIAGCGDDDGGGGGGGGTGLPFNEDDFDFELLLVGGGAYGRDVWTISIFAADYMTSIDTVELSINGESIPLNHYYDSWTGHYTGGAPGDQAAIDCMINGTDYSADIALCNTITDATFPDTWNNSQSNEILWTMDGDNMWQYISAFAEWYDMQDDEYCDEEKMFSLPTSARSYTAPANWFNISETEYDVSILVMSMNWTTNNGLLVASNTAANRYYNSWYDMQLSPEEIARKSLEALLDHIED